MARAAIGHAMLLYLDQLNRSSRPLGVRELARLIGRDGWREDRKYGPANRLVALGLAVWVQDPRRKDWRQLEPTAAGWRISRTLGQVEEAS
jgi:hypothetical protein